MPRTISSPGMSSRQRVARLTAALTTTLSQEHDADPDITWLEWLAALQAAQERAVDYLLTDERGED